VALTEQLHGGDHGRVPSVAAEHARLVGWEVGALGWEVGVLGWEVGVLGWEEDVLGWDEDDLGRVGQVVEDVPGQVGLGCVAVVEGVAEPGSCCQEDPEEEEEEASDGLQEYLVDSFVEAPRVEDVGFGEFSPHKL